MRLCDARILAPTQMVPVITCPRQPRLIPDPEGNRRGRVIDEMTEIFYCNNLWTSLVRVRRILTCRNIEFRARNNPRYGLKRYPRLVRNDWVYVQRRMT